MHRLLPYCLILLLAGCCTACPRPDPYRTASPPAPNASAVVFVADGSGDARTISTHLSQLAAAAGVPLQVEEVVWSLGYRRVVADHVSHANHLAQGRLLAGRVAAYRQACPSRKVYLVGYSAGCDVVLVAAEALPPGSVDRVILLAPAVCAAYDLRPTLRASRGGVDSFYSERDGLVLGLGVWVLGTADGACRSAAGRYGFTPVIAGPADAALYQGLRQYAWNPAVAWTGHNGGHYGSVQAGFLQAYVLPLLACD
jgi:pimeloyl-ACP methyl ester carboxylesterase